MLNIATFAAALALAGIPDARTSDPAVDSARPAGGAIEFAEGPATTAAAAKADAKLARCNVGVSARSADFSGYMRAVSGTRRMSMRFVLYERAGSAPFAAVDAPPLRTWRRSHAGARSYRFEQRVDGMRPGHDYRVTVHFRWTDSRGHRIEATSRRSGICQQPPLVAVPPAPAPPAPTPPAPSAFITAP